MALFRRNQGSTNTLPEIERYYEAEKRDRPGLAWLLAIVSIVAVAALVTGLFFSGRWVYHKVVHTTKTQVAVKTQTTSKPTSTTQSQQSTNSNSNKSTPSTGSNSTKSTSSPSSTSTNTGNGTNGANQSSGSTTQSTNKTSNTTTPTTTSNTTPTSTPAAQSTTKLTNTGPESVVPAFLAATVLGTLFYRFKTLRRN